ncbi:hypothetical protein RF11_00634 [Thelohanellus kitauei]|uniref:Uncharacterized protein n=1 Tax=Thelohanellus kitauei TaxID=669202 RepID=A0A0C2MBX0_THEKT|nr:hypothetical protein RF11_00634 [Thelohanellus kitauei]
MINSTRLPIFIVLASLLSREVFSGFQTSLDCPDLVHEKLVEVANASGILSVVNEVNKLLFENFESVFYARCFNGLMTDQSVSSLETYVDGHFCAEYAQTIGNAQICQDLPFRIASCWKLNKKYCLFKNQDQVVKMDETMFSSQPNHGVMDVYFD